MSFTGEAQTFLVKCISACMGFFIKKTMIKELEKDGKTPSEVTLGDIIEIGGGQEPPPPRPWQRLLLWFALISGVVLLIWMAKRLMNDLNTSS